MIGKSLFIGDQIEWTALDPEKDAEMLSAWTTNQYFSSQLFRKPARPYAVHEVKKKVKEDLKEADDKRNAYYFALRKKGTKEMVGLLKFGLSHVSLQMANIYLFFSSRESLNQYGAEVMGMAMRYGFMELSMHRLWIGLPGYLVDEINLYESAGFLRESQFREASFHEGKFYDLLGYSLLKPEWKKKQQEEVMA